MPPPPRPNTKFSLPCFQQTPIHAPFETKSPVGHGILHLFLVQGYPNMYVTTLNSRYLSITPPSPNIFGRPFLQYLSTLMMHHLNTTDSSHLAHSLHKMKTWIWSTCNLIDIFRINIYATISYTCKKTWPTRHKEQSKKGNVK
jgi:hypothetical protein